MGPRVFLTATWRHLAMFNYEVDPAILERRVPGGVELDSWEGRCFVTVVGFQFRIRGCSGFRFRGTGDSRK